ncbi:MAG: transposase [Anaerolineae bacterium]|nr:transposase [Anaerolineae bacterium]
MYEYRKLTPEQRQELVEERKALGFPPHQPPHPIQEDAYYLLTAACYEHQHHIHTPERRQMLLDLLFEHFTRHGMEIHAWVVMTNHYHLLVHVTEFEILGEIFRRIHGRTSHDWNQEDQTPGRKVWYRYSDRAIRSDRHYYTTLNYIHYNPLKHETADSPYNWPWSSVHWYLKHHGREWLRDLWQSYPLRDYGKTWDDI